MKINQKVRYGVLCLHELAKDANSYMTAEEIARRGKMPVAYIQKILQRLCAGGMIESVRGTGYRLLLPLTEISALRLIKALSDRPSPRRPAGPDIDVQFEQRFERALQSFNLAELDL